MKIDNKGFTLIELLIVIAIMGILATMALPSYQDRVIRVQVTEALALADIAQKGVEDYYKAKKRLPENNSQAGLPAPEKIVGNFVKKVEVSNGAVNVTLGNRVNKHIEGKVLTMMPAVVADAPIVPIAWVCGNASVPAGMTVKGKNNITDLLPRHLPVNCRY